MSEFIEVDASEWDYKLLTVALGNLRRQRAYVRGQQATGRAEALLQHLERGSAITAARELADAAAATMERDALKVEAEIAVITDRLRYLDHLHQYGGA